MSDNFNRREFLKAGTVVGLGAIAAGTAITGCTGQLFHPGQANMIGLKTNPKDLIKVGYIGIGNMGLGHIHNLTNITGCRVSALCDIRPERVDLAKKVITEKGFPEPRSYTKGDRDFVRLCENEDVDLVYNATPWRWHTPICLAAMKNGKHTATEVNAAVTIDECWKLVETSEKTRKHCIMMENCCYDATELMILNMVRKGLLGEILHAEGGYLHELRWHKFDENYYQGMWRLDHSIKRNGNLYPTHGLGPLAQCMDINRGDAFDYLVSMSCNSRGLNIYAEEKFGPDDPRAKQEYALGDVNTSLIKTKKGKTIILKHDTSTPRPYSRNILVQGTKGVVRKYPTQKIHLQGKTEPDAWEDLMETYWQKYQHPLWKAIQEEIKKAGDNSMDHGGMDYIEDYRLINALRKGIEPDMDVYDAAAWSAVCELTERSVANRSKPMDFPDFTRGKWNIQRPLQVDIYAENE
jgi:hypothetical protein